MQKTNEVSKLIGVLSMRHGVVSDTNDGKNNERRFPPGRLSIEDVAPTMLTDEEVSRIVLTQS